MVRLAGPLDAWRGINLSRSIEMAASAAPDPQGSNVQDRSDLAVS
jgi:hypothetical protein